MLAGIAASLLVLFLAFIGWTWFTTLQPNRVQPAPVTCNSRAPVLPADEQIKVLSWNVQFMAGKDYYFYYEGGSDRRPSPEAIDRTTGRVASIIKSEDPDLILLQEVDHGAKRTDHEDQLQNLLKQLPEDYSCYSSAFYWKAAFAPHPKIMGSVGMKLAIVSKYKIEKGLRHQLPLKPDNWFVRQFDLKRAALEARLPRKEGKDLAIFNTHLTAFAFGSDVRSRQVEEIGKLLQDRSSAGLPWITGGDFNLRPPGKGEENLSGSENSRDSREEDVLKPLFDRYRAIPGYEEVNGEDPEAWYTHFPNDPDIREPDKTIDYLFLSEKVSLRSRYVRSEDTLVISDHLPVIAEISL